MDQLRTTLTRTKNDTPPKSDRGTKNATSCKSDTGNEALTPVKSDMGVVTQLTPLPLAKVTDEGYPVEVTTQLIKSLPPTPSNAANSQSVRESLFSSHDEIETTSVSQLTELEQPELFGKEVAKGADKSMHSETKIDRQTPDLGLPKQPPTVTIASDSTDIAQSNQPVNKYSECSKRDAEGGTLSCDHRLKREPQLPKNIDGSVSLPWETHYRGKFDPEFEKWMARSLMQYPAFQNLMAGELLIKVRKHISAGKYDLKRRDELFIEWEALQSGVDVSEEAYGVTAKAASRPAKIRSALCS